MNKEYRVEHLLLEKNTSQHFSIQNMTPLFLPEKK